MPVPQIARYSWKELLSIVFCAVALPMALYQLYRGWFYHVIDVPLPPYRPWVASLATQPLWFAAGVAFFSLFSLLMPCVFWLLIWGLSQERRGFRIRETRPPLDEAIRQSFDDR